MPKIKSNSGAKKRFKVTGSGKIKRKHAYKSHLLAHKSKKQKKGLTKFSILDETEVKKVKKLIPYK